LGRAIARQWKLLRMKHIDPLASRHRESKSGLILR
jgi:hypothetical protein